MDPIAFRIGGFGIRWYGLMYVAALTVGLGLTLHEVRRKGLELQFVDLIDFALLAFPLGLIFARLYYVVFRLSIYLRNPWWILGLGGEGRAIGIAGFAIHGGLIGGGIALAIFSRWKRVSGWKFADSLVPSVILGQALGRLGNFLNGDAYGWPTSLPWGIEFPGYTAAGRAFPGQPLHPAMLYEMIFNLFAFVVLWSLRGKGHKDGFLAALYVMLYSAGRSAVSVFRADSLWAGPIRAAHLISLVLIVIFGALMLSKRLYQREEGFTS